MFIFSKLAGSLTETADPFCAGLVAIIFAEAVTTGCLLIFCCFTGCGFVTAAARATFVTGLLLTTGLAFGVTLMLAAGLASTLLLMTRLEFDVAFAREIAAGFAFGVAGFAITAGLLVITGLAFATVLAF